MAFPRIRNIANYDPTVIHMQHRNVDRKLAGVWEVVLSLAKYT